MACSNHPSSREMDEVLQFAAWSQWNLLSQYLSSERVGQAQALGKFAEYVSWANHQAFDLNFHDKNFPVFDTTSRTRICSIKTHSVGRAAGEIDVNSYTAEFREMIGAREAAKFEQAAQELFAARRILPVPDAVRDATSVDSVRGFLARNAQMQIPAEHVPLVQDALRRSISRDPALYNLSPAQVSPGVLDSIVARVVPIEV